MVDVKSRFSNNLSFNNFNHIFFIGNFFVSLGILLVTVGGSWDITNHLLNKPESFFSLPHALMYFGVVISLSGASFSFFGWKNLTILRNNYSSSLKITLVGISLLIGAGPFDFIWHSAFGLDGLLSPPHLILISGMFLSSLGGMIGISKYLRISNAGKNSSYLSVLAVLPFWLSGSGLVSSLSLPFSNTDYFKFNPDPVVGFFVAMIGFPFLISISVLLVFRLSDFRFGSISILGGIFLLISGFTAIIPNFAILDSLLFYSLNLMPFVISDLVLLFDRSKKSVMFVGGLLGSLFYMIYYPYVVYTFNELLLGKLVSPSLIFFVYFELIEDVLIFTMIPAILMGLLASLLSIKLSQRILTINS